MRRPALFALLALLGACADPDPEVDATLRARRIALGLEDAPLPLEESMRRIEQAHYDQAIARGDLDLDGALRLENLLARAEPGALPEDMLVRSRRLVSEYARGLAGGARAGPGGEAGPIARSCLACHLRYRK